MIFDYQIRVLPQVAANEHAIMEYLAREKGHDIRSMNAVRVLRRSIDARQRTIFMNLTVRLFVNELPPTDDFICREYRNVEGRPPAIVVGAGPAGLFAALKLIEKGIRPIVVERGKDVRSRKVDVANIARTHTVDPESNYCFGEGGAGAYSDGKLYTRSKKRGSIEGVLNLFCQHGASASILADAHPHLGTDKLPRIIENMRKTILVCGGEVHFNTRMDEILIKNGRVCGIATSRGEILADAVILATGHSAKDVYRKLYAGGVALESKGIAVGVRLEHPSQLIDCIRYHNPMGRGKYLPAAEYSFTTQVDGRGVYSFCMCPGGVVVPSASGSEELLVNGMSPSHRGGRWSNSGMVVQVNVEDVAHPDMQMEVDGIEGEDFSSPLAVLNFQERLERLCWLMGNRRQTAPAQRMTDFVNSKLSYDLPDSSYAPGLISSPMHFWMPRFISSRLQRGFELFGRSSRGFLTREATVIGMETRTSSPIRIVRDADTLQHTQIGGLFPCGEGAGYAGGIVSAAVDGERCAVSAAEYIDAFHVR
ncbi:MAG: NAD(P)/FAD-dependent oxidoreductase [Bacteroidaceae bacterium]|nr:NAD(P)/FAD-dependent oxidoreductase [Bacteroidaceae bacterium]